MTATGDATALSGIMRLVAAAQASASRAQALADRAAALLFYVALAAGAITLVVLVAPGRPGGRAGPDGDGPGHRLPARPRPGDPAGHRHLDLARRPERPARQGPPGAGAGADPGHGDLRQDRDPHQGRAGPRRRAGDPEVLRLAAAVEADSEHPLARAIVAGAQARDLEVPTATDFEALAGRGARAQVEGKQVRVGGPRLLADLGLAPLAGRRRLGSRRPDRPPRRRRRRVAGAIAVEDEIRPESREADRRASMPSGSGWR